MNAALEVLMDEVRAALIALEAGEFKQVKDRTPELRRRLEEYAKVFTEYSK